MKQSAGMVDISEKKITKRTARARATVKFPPKAFTLLLREGSPKGDVFETARVAGIMAAKSTPQIIPFCHPLELGKTRIDFEIVKSRSEVKIFSEVIYSGKTGVEMEALTAVAVAALTIYDLMKWADKGIAILEILLDYKSGGKSGVFQRR